MDLQINEHFEVRFAQTYPDFTKKLVGTYNSLSFQEVKVCMFIKMSFSNRQIQNELNLSKSSLANLRSSIRKKMALNRGQSLTNSILCF